MLARALDLSAEREAILESAADLAHPPRRRTDAPIASLLRVVRPRLQTTPRHNLSHQLTSFVGRQHDADEIVTLLRHRGLVTVVGAGGVGKARIAVQLGIESLTIYPDGVWLVDLSPLADPTLVADAVLAALRLPSTSGSPLDVVVPYLKSRHLMLILENCEHVIAQARDVAASIVESCSQVRVGNQPRAVGRRR